PLAQY
ncbi:hypothetical protein VTL71DRAFT_16587, partial [Oculimacula yallundae]